jgi:hypothetical protein
LINKLPDPPLGSDYDNPAWKAWFSDLNKWQRKEGYFTPVFTGLTVGGAGGAVTHYAHWYKYGNRVHVEGLMSTNGTGTLTLAAWNGCYLTNPPFLIAPSNNSLIINPYGGVWMASNGTTTGQVWAFGDSTTNQGRIYFTAGGPTTADNDIYWNINYQTDA